MRVMAIYPPGRNYQRGEDRSQGNLDNSVSTSMRAANDLGYISAISEELGHASFIKDYQSEKLSFEKLKQDFLNFDPDLLVLSITNSTIFEDLDVVEKIKKLGKKAKIALKGLCSSTHKKRFLNSYS